jgi:hypothetical protein
VGDALPEGSRLAEFGVRMDAIVVARQVRERQDVLLGYRTCLCRDLLTDGEFLK